MTPTELNLLRTARDLIAEAVDETWEARTISGHESIGEICDDAHALWKKMCRVIQDEDDAGVPQKSLSEHIADIHTSVGKFKGFA